MNRERTPMDAKEIDIIIEKMQRRGKYSSEIIQLVQSDLEHGIAKEETEQYTNKKYDIRQMRVYSNCLRRNCSQEEISVICKEGLSNCQMEVLYDFFDKGVSLETIGSIMEKAEGIPQRMKKLYENYQEEISKAMSVVEVVSQELDSVVDTDYIKELLTLLHGIFEKITYQEERYDELNKNLKLFENSKEDEAVRKNLIGEMDERDSMLEKQQEELNKATGAIARLRKDKEKYEEEIRKMGNQMEELQRTVKSQEFELQEGKHRLKQPYGKEKEMTEINEIDKEQEQPINTTTHGKSETQEPTKNVFQPRGYGIPVYYQIPVVDRRGHLVQKVPIDHSAQKTSGIVSLLAKLGFKKKSRGDIVKLVASGDLVPAQLIQIKSGIEKGLTEGQLVELINNNLSAEKMKEIIEIAVLENSMIF
ncbi:hypothetical protein acsn021_39120 [Anaerocolumna cellulosilytica]|uniref:Uncharacterized protein n=1 Tax=Anaerocolumna cellulosilytica TaxID=433286 RepID=A0A6S6QYQ1_9FIRM|nr:hypothetical protein [Anaerocolumna cellulosilytica]MBB5196314.1 vacuolar-type H+-ATPase subunit I/STV1 [Anaerocolumna cellulosilytica]BCJ96343.1 hypothetical protein acsn021_39120 [Anaerocolumna cellulosilytica]